MRNTTIRISLGILCVFLCAFIALNVDNSNTSFTSYETSTSQMAKYKSQSQTVSANYKTQTTSKKFPFRLPFFSRCKKEDTPITTTHVYVGGTPLGLQLMTQGLIVTDFPCVITTGGRASPSLDAKIKKGDVLTHLNNFEVNSNAALLRILANYSPPAPMPFSVLRDGNLISGLVRPVKDIKSSTYRIGLKTKDTSSGIGTLTFVTKDGRFGTLGHPVCDGSLVLPVSKGRVYTCNIVGITKGKRGDPGELTGLFVRGKPLGTILRNHQFGVFGRLDTPLKNAIMPNLVEVAKRGEVKAGKAQIITTLSSGLPKLYDIEIIKVSKQNSPKEKGIVLKIKDKRLISETGGVVQGMSGSPIIQNGKIVGAVTHVFINDPSKGYGIFIEFMLQQVEKIEAS
ncbi:MAG: SpoIVB peptidase [Firmicutes bacterium]|nr:SpoIVB peptidase [Bacillota bacterium]